MRSLHCAATRSQVGYQVQKVMADGAANERHAGRHKPPLEGGAQALNTLVAREAAQRDFL